MQAEKKLKETMEADGFVFWTNHEKDAVRVVDNYDGTKNLSLDLACCGKKVIDGPFADVRISEFAYTAWGTRDLGSVGVYVKHPIAESV